MKTKKFRKEMTINALAPQLAVCMPGYSKKKHSTGNTIKGVAQFYIDSENKKENELVYHASLVGSSKSIPLSRNLQDYEKICISVNILAGTISYSQNGQDVKQTGEDCFLWEQYGSIFVAFLWSDKPVIVEIASDYNCIYLYHSTGELDIIANRFLNPKDHLMAKSITDVKYQLAQDLAVAIMNKATLAA